MKKLIIALLAASLMALGGTAFAAQSKPGEGTTIHPATATWRSAKPTLAIFTVLLEDLGYSFDKPTVLSNPIFYKTVTRKSGPDFWTGGWFPSHYTQLPDDFKQHASIVGTIVKNGAIQGFLVSKKAAKKYDITSLADFKRPEVRKAFDRDGDGKAEIMGCPPGWGCHVQTNFIIKAYGLGKYIDLTEASYAASFADLLARYRNGEPIAFYTWTPNFTIFKLKPGQDVVWINVPEPIKLSPAAKKQGFDEQDMVVSGIKGAVTDPLRMGFVANDISVVANNAFLQANPAAKKLFELVKIPLTDISGMTARILDGENSHEAIMDMAKEWISKHQDEVDGWLQAARQAAAD